MWISNKNEIKNYGDGLCRISGSNYEFLSYQKLSKAAVILKSNISNLLEDEPKNDWEIGSARVQNQILFENEKWFVK